MKRHAATRATIRDRAQTRASHGKEQKSIPVGYFFDFFKILADI